MKSNISCQRHLTIQFVAFVLAWALAVAPTFSSNPHISSPPTQMFDAASALVSFAQIASSAPEIVLSAETAKVTIHRVDGLDAITVSSNCPNHWRVSGNIIRQVAFSTTTKGVSVRADATGAQALVNGHIYQLPQGPDGAIHGLKIENGNVVINGEILEPLAGSSIPGSCTGPDIVNIQIPKNYDGNLILSCHGGTVVSLDTWNHGSITASLLGHSNLITGELRNLTKAAIDAGDGSQAKINGLIAKTLVANINGSGKIEIDNGNTEMTNATISGSGSILLKGNIGNLRKSVIGNGTIQVN